MHKGQEMYKITKKMINHLLYMDDIKLFATKKKKNLKTLIETIRK